MTILRENTETLPATKKGAGVFEVRLINTGWGSSGYYSEALLEEYGPKTFTKNRACFANHATEAELATGRDITKIMGRLTEDAVYRDGALYGTVKVVPDWVDFVDEFKDTIGMSIFASGNATKGEAEGRKGVIVESFDSDNAYTSVDFVVAAGRGGKVLEMAEAAKSIEEATANDRRMQLAALVSKSANKYAYVLDYDDGNVWYDSEDGTFQQTYSVTNDIATSLEGQATKVAPKTTYVAIETSRTHVPGNPVETDGTKMDKDIEQRFDTLAESFATLVGLLTPKTTEKTETDFAAVAESVVDAGLSKSARVRVFEAVKGGAEAEKAIESEKALKEEYLKEFEAVATAEGASGRIVEGSTADADWDALAKSL